MNKPLVSAVMLVYNSEEHLREAIDSVLNQTFKDFELVIVNDGSTDSSLEIIDSYDDDRIRLVDNGQNRGLAYSRNVGLKEARGAFLAWCDSDDINLPTRFEDQVKFLQENPSYGLCGSWQTYSIGKRKLINKTFKDPEILKAILLFTPSIMNPTAMLRMSMVREHGITFNNDLAFCEDYDFFQRSSMHFPLTNVQKVLLKYRVSDSGMTMQFEAQEERNARLHKVVYAQALEYLGIRPKEEELNTHRLICSNKKFDSFEDFKNSFEWLNTIKKKNQETKVYQPRALEKVLADQFYFISKKATRFGLSTLQFYLAKSLSGFGHFSLNKASKLAVRCIIK